MGIRLKRTFWVTLFLGPVLGIIAFLWPNRVEYVKTVYISADEQRELDRLTAKI
jgi:hypothetical protein